MKAAELIQRRKFDFRILDDMRGLVFSFRAYQSTSDLRRDRNQITTEAAAGVASKYAMTLRVPTLIGPGKFAAETTFGVDTDVADYPMAEPLTWLISKPIPWSPHFLTGRPICLGSEFWLARMGHVTLGHLVIHVAMMLNWDEKGRGPGYVGWNREAIQYHAKHYKGQKLNPDLRYPALPEWLAGPVEQRPAFDIIAHQRPGQ